jgi:hypothetical protein
MPLSASSDRTHLHTRTIKCEGYQREDGLFDIEGWLTDTKTYDFKSTDRGEVKAGVPVHGMGLRLTIDRDMTVHGAEAAMDFTPFNMCPKITPNFQRLVGLNLSRGFTNAVRDRLGGIEGCVHLVDLLRPMATTAYQVLSPFSYDEKVEKSRRGEPVEAFFFNACHAWQEDGEIARDQFPSLVKAKD